MEPKFMEVTSHEHDWNLENLFQLPNKTKMHEKPMKIFSTIFITCKMNYLYISSNISSNTINS